MLYANIDNMDILGRMPYIVQDMVNMLLMSNIYMPYRHIRHIDTYDILTHVQHMRRLCVHILRHVQQMAQMFHMKQLRDIGVPTIKINLLRVFLLSHINISNINRK